MVWILFTAGMLLLGVPCLRLGYTLIHEGSVFVAAYRREFVPGAAETASELDDVTLSGSALES